MKLKLIASLASLWSKYFEIGWDESGNANLIILIAAALT